MSNETAIIKCGTSKGDFTMELHRSWSPIGYDRAVELFDRGFYDGSHFYRVVPKFLVQFGISYTTDVELKQFAQKSIPDDPQHDPVIPFEEGTVSFAGSGNNSRTSQLFISYGRSKSLGTRKWETPVGTVIEGMERIQKLHSYAGIKYPWGDGPVQAKIRSGSSYMEENFPLSDKFLNCKVKRRTDGWNKLSSNSESTDDKRNVEKQWSIPDGQYNQATAGDMQEQLRTTFQTLRGKVQESEDGHDMIALAAIIIIVLTSVVFKLATRRDKGSSKSS
ncbi:peptidyl-prolyl cis-trans isomerase [Fragilaria crotonensis]|nr:peptidyl-prolyl cis-trans isomerase [Fragilaria crotonensis]